MKCYIVAIGGTGSRVVRSIVHLAGARVFDGMGDVERINVMVVDSDANNGDKCLMEEDMTSYDRIRSLGAVMTPISINEWPPLNVFAKKLDDPSLMDYANLNEMKPVYEFLYTDDERTKVLKGGFYSHTSIGSYYMNTNITNDAGEYVEPWNSFFADIQPSDKIILIGSIFGGTGASGVPTLARVFKAANRTSNCQLGGIFVGPYFRTIKEDAKKDLINWESFSAKAKIALNYYEMQKIQELFTRMYFLGEKPGAFMATAHHIDAIEQRNKANTIELYAATAVIDFIRDNGKNAVGHSNVKIAWRGTEYSDLVCARKDLNTVAGEKVYLKMAQFLAFSIFYKNVLYPAIKDPKARGAKFKNYYLFDGCDELMDYCNRYILWMREMITETNSEGEIAVNGEPNRRTDWFAEKEYMLYNGAAPKTISASERAQFIDRLEGEYRRTYSDDTPGFTRIVRLGSGINSAQLIYSDLCDVRRPRGGNIGKLITDVITLAWGGTINAKE